MIKIALSFPIKFFSRKIFELKNFVKTQFLCIKAASTGSIIAPIYNFFPDNVVTGGEKDRKLTTWDSAIDFAKKTETKLPEGVGAVRSLSKQNLDQSDRDSAVYIGK